jgi:hypothetical protein
MTAKEVWEKLCPECAWNDGGAEGLTDQACLWGNPDYRRAAFDTCPLLKGDHDS